MGKNNLHFKITLDKEPTHRHKDENGYLIVNDNPIAFSGVYDYLASEIDETKGDEVKKVYRPFDDLEAKKDYFASKPIQWEHVWTGENGDKQDVAGVIGEKISAKNGGLFADLTIYNADLIKKIENGEVVELSPGYDCEFLAEKGSYGGESYDFKQVLKNVNHLAVVERGRTGHDLRIQDNENKKIHREEKKLKKSILDSLINALKKAQDEEVAVETTNDEGEIESTVKGIIENADLSVEEKTAQICSLFAPKTTDEDETQDEDEPKTEDESETQDENEPETETKDEGEEVAVENDEVEELKEALSEAIEEAVEKKVGDAMRMLKANQKAVNDALNEVRGVVGNFDSSRVVSANDAYSIGYEALTGEKLAKAMDAKTAFIMAKKAQRPSVKTKDSASKKSEVSSLVSRFK